MVGDYVLDAAFIRLFGVEVTNAYIDTDPSTKSRSNKALADAIAEMLFALYERQPYPDTSITIITPYTAQRVLHMTTIKTLHTRTELPYAKLPRVSTVDAMQGHESNVIILDWVVGPDDKLGFLADDRRVNVALTRARTNMIVFYSDSSSKTANKKRKTTPELVAHIMYLMKRDRALLMNGGDDVCSGVA